MGGIRNTNRIRRRRVLLTLKAPNAKTVAVMGDFNQWNEKKHPMRKKEDGTWEKIILVPPGKYEYRFLVDGEWWNDPANPLARPNEFGTVNNVMDLP